MFFEDRKDAGKRLVTLLEKYKGAEDTIVLGLPRGGIAVALEVALELELPLDVWVTRKIGAPFNPELAIGSIDSNGNLLMDENTIKLYEVSERYVREEAGNQAEEIKRRYKMYRGTEQAPDIKGKTVLVIDDGIATGYTMLAALQSVKSNEATKIICAVPVSSPRIINKIKTLADEFECLSAPSYFGAVGEFYRNFSQVSDDEVMDYLKQAARS